MLQKNKSPNRFKTKKIPKKSSPCCSKTVNQTILNLFGSSYSSSKNDSTNNKNDSTNSSKSPNLNLQMSFSNNNSNTSENFCESPINKDHSYMSVENNTSKANNNTSKANNTTSSAKSTSSPKKTRKRAVYNYLDKFSDRKSCDTHVRSISKYGYIVKHNNGLVNCTQCECQYNKHEMHQMYWKCNCGGKSCTLAWKVTGCEETNEWILCQTGEVHEEDYVVTTRVIGHKPKKRYGIALHVKELFLEWLKRDDMTTFY